jgi:hypothetical protein
VEVRVGSRQFFVCPAHGLLAVQDLDSKEKRITPVAEGSGKGGAAAGFSGGTATCDGIDVLVVFPGWEKGANAGRADPHHRDSA